MPQFFLIDSHEKHHSSRVFILIMATGQLHSHLVFLLSAFFLFSYSVSDAQFPKKEKFYAVKEDIEHVRCETCQKAIKYLNLKTHEMRDESPAKKLEEDKIIELVEKSCDPGKQEGEWITKLDIVQQDGKLHLEEQKDYGRCQRECQTIAKACEESIGEADTDLAELLWQNKLTLSKLINKYCYSLTKSCGKKAKKIKTNWKNEKFVPMTEDERKADTVMKQMRGIPGMPGMEMYSRDDIEKAKEQMEKQKEHQKELPIDEEGLLYAGESVSFWQMVKDGVSRISSWFKSIFQSTSQKSEF